MCLKVVLRKFITVLKNYFETTRTLLKSCINTTSLKQLKIITSEADVR